VVLDAGCDVICLDVAHGDHKMMYSAIDKVVKLKDKYKFSLMAGNVCTPEATTRFSFAGVDIVKVGIGCFVGDTMVYTSNGFKSIQNIRQGDQVKSHTGKFRTVLRTFRQRETQNITSINDIKCTKNHKFYAVHKKHKDILNDDNIHEYAEWIEAQNLTKDYFLIKNKE